MKPDSDAIGFKPIVEGESEFVITKYRKEDINNFTVCKINDSSPDCDESSKKYKGEITPNKLTKFQSLYKLFLGDKEINEQENKEKLGTINFFIPYRYFYNNETFKPEIQDNSKFKYFSENKLDASYFTPEGKNKKIANGNNLKSEPKPDYYDINFEPDYFEYCFIPIFGCYSVKNKKELAIGYIISSIVPLLSWYQFQSQHSRYEHQLNNYESLMIASIATHNNALLFLNSGLYSKIDSKNANSEDNKMYSLGSFLTIYILGTFLSLLITNDDPWNYPFNLCLDVRKKPTNDPSRRIEDNYEITFKVNF